MEVYDTIVSPLTTRFLSGESCSLIAYGMTAAGKTHTIQGTTKDPGVFPRLVTALLEKSSDLVEPVLHLSILEIYQEKLNDLLASGTKKDRLTIRDGNGHIEVANLSSHEISSAKEAHKALDYASGKRFD